VDFITEHIKWIFSGVGVAAVTGLIALLHHRQSNSRQVHRQGQSVRNGSSAYQAGRDIMINAVRQYNK